MPTVAASLAAADPDACDAAAACMQYPFNVQDAIVWMADHVDLILIFFDPIGQATCKRTMEVVERLNQSHNVEKLHYFM